MVQKAAPASDEFAQKGLDALKLPKRTPADTTGLVDTPESIAKNKKDLLYRTVGYTGAEMMAGKSPFAMVNIGEALSKGFSAYAQQIGEHKKATKEDIKDLAAIRRAEAALEQNDLKMGVDIITNELTNKRALEVAEMQVKGHLDAARIGAESRRLDKSVTPFEAWQKGSPEEKANIERFTNLGKDKRDFGPEQRIKLEQLWTEEEKYDDKYKGLKGAKLEDAKQQWMGSVLGMGGGGGGETDKYSGAKEQRYQAWLKSQGK
jgi:hypothetical protein